MSRDSKDYRELVDWERVEQALDRDEHKIVWKPYGLPSITSLEKTSFVPGATLSPRWDIDERVAVEVAVTGGFFRSEENPHQPLTTEAILAEAQAVARAGASAVHLHMRADSGYNTLSLERFRQVVEPLRDEFPSISVDGCLVCSLRGEWEEMKRVIESRLLDAIPINTTATYVGDSLFAKPIPVILEKTRLVREAGLAPQIAVYTDADIDNAERLLFSSGLVEEGSCWLILPALPGCSPMRDPRQMIEGVMRMTMGIRAVDPEARIVVCAAGRPSLHLSAVAAVLGLHLRVGMEDTVWKWPHRDQKLTSNLDAFTTARDLVTSLGRRVATMDEYRDIFGLPAVALAPTGAAHAPA